MLATPPLRWARIAMILSLVSMTLLLLRNNLIPLHQSLNFVLSLLNHSRSGTMFLGTPACPLFPCVDTGAIDISSVYSIVLSETSFVICKNSSYSDNVSISLSWYQLIFVSCGLTTYILFFPIVKPSIILCRLTTSVLSFCKVSLPTIYQMLWP